MAEVSYVLAFLAGLVTIATPCILPILPPMLAGSLGHRLRPLMIVSGMAVSFTLMGGLFSGLGIAAGISGGIYRLIIGFVIIGFGAIMVDDEINETYVKYSTQFVNLVMGPFSRGTTKVSGGGELRGAFLLGLTLGIIWIPCVGPILGAVLTYASSIDNVLGGSLLLLAYSIGLGTPMLAIAYGGKYISGKIGGFKNIGFIKKVAGWVLIITGVSIILGLDNALQRALLPYFPDTEGILLGN
jgi:cytochrome c biogenesis protein CcdA